MPKNTTKRPSRLTLITPPTLTEAEAERIAEKLGVALEHNSEDISLLLLLVNHLETIRDDPADFLSATFAIKQKLFLGTIAAEMAQEHFESQAMASRGDLLMWPTEKIA